eukprot:CAMPEP_0182460716 /NCGR_PEP_ID=MMETSP1319-20130603/5500_1 /TAXON_ID=172717 /ORGANISM="Bolidomonas pacifica, Strain RCC208" /LENGTH=312 /DNA_ID=CAMNT_0024659861 /DNA_START=249 /DNA_END=1184 /DNA_ORIENTATION=+
MRVAITGALSYTGRYLTKELLSSSSSSPLATSILNFSRRTTPISSTLSGDELEKISSTPLPWGDSKAMGKSLEGVDVLYCTYWIRFERGGDTHAAASDRVASLFRSAAEAGVKKVVFSSHTRASVDSPYSYIAGKARAVESLREISAGTGMNYAVVRPCGIFGDSASESILMNNATYVLRRSPLFLLPGDGSGRFQPVHVRDMASLMTSVGAASPGTSGEELDACGPDCPTAYELFSHLNDSCGGISLVLPSRLPTTVVSQMTRPIDWFTGDVLLDGDDLDLLDSGITVADNPDDPRIKDRRSLFEWVEGMG